MNELKPLIIGDTEIKKPIFQGGMAIRISLSDLVSAVSNSGALGILAGTEIGQTRPDYYTNQVHANKTVLLEEIQKIKEKIQGAPFGLNLMTVLKGYGELVSESAKAGIPFIISGGGLFRGLSYRLIALPTYPSFHMILILKSVIQFGSFSI